MQVPKFIVQIFLTAYALGGLQAIMGFEEEAFYDLMFLSMIIQQLPIIQWNFLAFIVDMTRILKKRDVNPPTQPSPPSSSTSEESLLSLSDFRAKEKDSGEKKDKDSTNKKKAA